MSKRKLESSLRKAKKTIIEGLDSTFEYPDVHEKYLWLKKEYEKLIILEAKKPKLYDLGYDHDEHNIHFSFTDRINKMNSK